MALSDTTGTYGIRDCKIIPIVTDTESGVTYGSLIDIVGIQSVEFNPTFVEEELRGDDDVLDVYSKISNWEFSLNYGELSFNALAAFTGGTVTNAGSTPNQSKTFTQTKTDMPKYFKLIGRSAYSTDNPAGDIHVVFYKCKITDLGHTFPDTYGEFSASGRAIARIYDGRIFDLICHETATEIAAEPSVTALAAFTDNSISASISSVVILAVKATGAGDVPVPFARVNWEVTSEDTLAGILSGDISYTDADGIAYIYYTTGSGAGDNTVTASVGAYTVTFTITCA